MNEMFIAFHSDYYLFALNTAGRINIRTMDTEMFGTIMQLLGH